YSEAARPVRQVPLWPAGGRRVSKAVPGPGRHAALVAVAAAAEALRVLTAVFGRHLGLADLTGRACGPSRRCSRGSPAVTDTTTFAGATPCRVAGTPRAGAAARRGGADGRIATPKPPAPPSPSPPPEDPSQAYATNNTPTVPTTDASTASPSDCSAPHRS